MTATSNSGGGRRRRHANGGPPAAPGPHVGVGDSLQNLVTGFGTAKDKRTHSTHVFVELDKQQLDAAYRSDWVARKIVDCPAQDATREWRSWQAENADITKIEKLEKSLHVQRKVKQARTLARLYGGSIMFLGVGDENPSSELRPEGIKKDSLRYVHVVGRHEVGAGNLVTDVTSPLYGEHSHYDVRGPAGNVRVHPSRVVKFIGAEVPDITQSQGWGDSSLQAVDDAVKDVGLCSGGIAQLVWELKIDVIRIPEFMANVSQQNYRELLVERMQLANMAKSLVNALMMDKEEEWSRIETDLSGTPDILKVYLLIASGAADIPATRLLGQSPAGLSSTGESDIRNYYDRIASDQKNDMAPALEPLTEILIRSSLGARPEDIFYEWNPLWQMSELEKADLSKKKAETFKIDVDSGLIPEEALAKARANQLVEDGTYPGLEAAIKEAEKNAESIDENDPEVQAAEEARAAREKDPVADPEKKSVTTEKVAAKDAKPRTLYVRRDVLNGEDLVAWAESQGLEVTVPMDKMHVTIAFSRAPVDWMKVEGDDWGGEQDGGLVVKPGGPRLVEVLGPRHAVVLMFSSSRLSWRHESIKREGASWDWPEYQPHVTISFGSGEPGAQPPDLSDVEPYRGEIRFGPEIFEELDENWSEKVGRRSE